MLMCGAGLLSVQPKSGPPTLRHTTAKEHQQCRLSPRLVLRKKNTFFFPSNPSIWGSPRKWKLLLSTAQPGHTPHTNCSPNFLHRESEITFLLHTHTFFFFHFFFFIIYLIITFSAFER